MHFTALARAELHQTAARRCLPTYSLRLYTTMHARLTLCAFLPALLQALQPARAPPARPVSTRARATVMANSLTTISANNLKMTDNIKACGAPRPLDTAPPETPARRERRRERSQARRGANATARRYVEEKIGGVVEKYAGVSQRCDTHLSVMRNPAVADSDVAEVVVFCKGEVVRAEERSPSMYSSIDLVADKVARKLRKVKERREGKRNKPQLKMSLGEMLEDPVEMEPEVFDATSLIRRKTHAMPAQSLSDAMICMDGLDHDFYMFTNEETGKINVMYKRKEGGLGLIEPEN